LFDCRAIHNPGRYAGWKHLTGRDPEIEVFFSQQSKMYDFLTDVYRIIDRSIESYQSNNYKHLQVAFGCTGGRHRSVFAAEKLAAYLNENHDIELELDHRDLLI
jgi:RNase adaptor protein for sRNA GlmZ degradation